MLGNDPGNRGDGALGVAGTFLSNFSTSARIRCVAIGGRAVGPYVNYFSY